MLSSSLFRKGGVEGGGQWTDQRIRLLGFKLSMISLLLTVGCGSSSDFSAATSAGVGSNGAAPSGVLETVAFRVPTGETMTLTSDLTVLAKENIEIAGDLVFAPGVSVTLIADGDLVVDGKIVPQGVLGRQHQASHSPPVVNPDLRAQTESFPQPILRLGGRTVRVTGTLEGSEGMDIFVANKNGGSSTAVAVISGTVTAGPGAPGTASSTKGGEGGTVHLGSPAAIQLFENRPAVSGVDRVGQFSAPTRLEITGVVRGGAGGEGFTDTVGRSDGAFRSFEGGLGGDGGDVQLDLATGTATESPLLVTPGSVIGGAGGKGGSCTGRGLDGPASLDSGESVNVVSGGGGVGGDASLAAEARESSDGLFLPGLPGLPGDSLVTAGNGGAGGDGGTSIIALGSIGNPGMTSGSSFVTDETPVRSVTISLKDGGNGGQGLANNPPGKGGGLQLFPDSALRTNRVRLKFIAENCSNGGKGRDVCEVNGFPTDGAASGLVEFVTNLNELSLVPELTFTNSFNGGDGGDGGDGAVPGFTDGGPGLNSQEAAQNSSELDLSSQLALLMLGFESSFEDGAPGGPCPQPPQISFSVDIDPAKIGAQLELDFDYAEADPNCEELPLIELSAPVGEGLSIPVSYVITPRPPSVGVGITLDVTSGTLQPGETRFITPTFDCTGDSFSQGWDLSVTGTPPSGQAINRDFVFVYSGTKTMPEPCVTQAMFRNDSGFPRDIRLVSNGTQVGIDVLIPGFPPNNVYVVTEDFQLDDLEIRYGSTTVSLGQVVPCGSRGVFLLNAAFETITAVETIPAP